MALELLVNGKRQSVDVTSATAEPKLPEVLTALGIKLDRVAVEHNGEIVRRSRWDGVEVSSGDRLEIVHFVGGGNTTAGSG